MPVRVVSDTAADSTLSWLCREHMVPVKVPIKDPIFLSLPEMWTVAHIISENESSPA